MIRLSWSNLVIGFREPVSRIRDASVSSDRTVLVRGRNGSGKTTLLRTLAGLLPPLEGSIGDPSIMRTFIHSNPFLFRGSVASTFRLTHARTESVARAAERFGVDDLFDRDVEDLSTGQRARVALARAIAIDPDLLLVDETIAALDDQGLAAWQDFTSEAIDRLRPLIIVATHDVPDAPQSKCEVIFLSDRADSI